MEAANLPDLCVTFSISLTGDTWLSGQRTTRLLRAGHVGWVTLDVNNSVSDWLQQDRHQLSLHVVVSDARSRTQLNTIDVFQAPSCIDHQLPHEGT